MANASRSEFGSAITLIPAPAQPHLPWQVSWQIPLASVADKLNKVALAIFLELRGARRRQGNSADRAI